MNKPAREFRSLRNASFVPPTMGAVATDLAKALRSRQERLGGTSLRYTSLALTLLIQVDELFNGAELQRQAFESALLRLAN